MKVLCCAISVFVVGLITERGDCADPPRTSQITQEDQYDKTILRYQKCIADYIALRNKTIGITTPKEGHRLYPLQKMIESLHFSVSDLSVKKKKKKEKDDWDVAYQNTLKAVENLVNEINKSLVKES